MIERLERIRLLLDLGANLRGAKLWGANLEGAKGLPVQPVPATDLRRKVAEQIRAFSEDATRDQILEALEA